MDRSASESIGIYSSIVADSSGTIYIAYYDSTNKDLKFLRYNAVTMVSSMATIDSVEDVGVNPSIALDSAGEVHISYYDSTNSGLKYATNSSG